MDDNPYRGPISPIASAPRVQKNRLFSAVGKVLAVLGIIVIVICMMLPAVRTAREPARRSQCTNNLKQIALALHNYADAYDALPPAYTVDASGKPLHSWRTLILPYMEEQQLYKSIDFTKSWDDPANAQAFKTVPYGYQCPSELAPDNRTTYLAILTPTSCIRPTEPRKISDITDGDRETLMVIEVDSEHAVPWMSPSDADENVVLAIGAESKLAHPGGMNGLFVDGSVRFLTAEMPVSQRRALISIAGNDSAAAAGED